MVKALIYSLAVSCFCSMLLGQDQTSVFITDLNDKGSTIQQATDNFLKHEACKGFRLTRKRNAANYEFIFADGGWARPRTVSVVNLDADETVIYADNGRTQRFKNLVKDACNAVTKDLPPPQ